MKIQMIKKLGIVSCLAVACAVVSPSVVRAQSGFTFQWGTEKENILAYCIDNASAGSHSRYYLEVQPQKFKVSEILIVYNERWNSFNERNGNFDTSEIKLRKNSDCRGGQDIEIESATWDKENRRITIVPKEAIPSKTSLYVVLSNVRNPDYSGFYKFTGRVLRSDVPVPEPIGTWMITLD
jgi:hypothetical protein